MYFFDKKTEYLIWKLNDGQARGVGTVKFSVMDEVCRIEVTVTGCAGVTGTYQVYLLSGDLKSLLGEIVLEKGRGILYLRGNTAKLGHQAFPYKRVTGIFIDLKTEGCLEQKWLPIIHVSEGTEVTEAVDIPEKDAESETECTEAVEPEMEQIEQTEKTEEQSKEPVVEKKEALSKPVYRLHTEKWQQLCAIYPIVHPFGDGRAYLSIEPRDFVVLQEKFQPLVQNSFLLHGFYHYKHLLLGRHKQGANVQYYLGVPGVFYEKEKSAALFYGFESFEGAVSPAAEGDFGYYLKKVLL